VLTFDCLHDMTHPDVVAAAIRRAIRDDGVWLIKDIRCGDTFDDNSRNPMLAMMYGVDHGCMSSASSEPGGAGSAPWVQHRGGRVHGAHAGSPVHRPRLRGPRQPLLRGAPPDAGTG
jgi:hypothetical protein